MVQYFHYMETRRRFNMMPNSLPLFILKCIRATYPLGVLVTEVPVSQDMLGVCGATFKCTNNSSLNQEGTSRLSSSLPHLVSKCVLTIMTNNEEVLASCLRRTKQRVFLQLSWTLAVVTSAANRLSTGGEQEAPAMQIRARLLPVRCSTHRTLDATLVRLCASCLARWRP